MKEALNTSWVGKKPPQRKQRDEEKELSTSIRINEEFSKIIPPLTVSEKYNLHKSLKKEGCRDPLVIWNGTLIDGHNRYKYCTENNIPFKVVERHFSDDDEAKLWMIENQMARRNLNKAAKLLLEDERKKIIARQSKKKQESTHFKEGNKCFQKSLTIAPILGQPSKDDKSGRTDRQLSDATGIAHGTIAKFNYVQKHAEDFDEGDLIRQMCEETVDDENRKMTIARAYNKIKQKERQEELRHKGFPLNKYEVIYVDSKANNWDLVKRHPVSEIAKHNAILFLWAIPHEVEQGLKMMEHWNFKFDNCVVWNFVEPEECRGVEVTHDILLIGAREAFHDFCPHEKGVLLPGIHCKPREEGQAKRPQEYKELIHKLYPTQVKVDLFGDEQSEGWENYNQEENAKHLWR